jgi:predicted XRE-type DNA-binding protein
MKKLIQLKMAIYASGMTQRQVSAKTHIPETKLSDIIRGKARASDREKQLLSVVLVRPASELFREERICER